MHVSVAEYTDGYQLIQWRHVGAGEPAVGVLHAGRLRQLVEGPGFDVPVLLAVHVDVDAVWKFEELCVKSIFLLLYNED